MPYGSSWTNGSFILVLSLNLLKSPSVGYFPLGGQVRGQVSLCLSLASGGSPTKVRQIMFRTGYLDFCFGYFGHTGYTGY
jgi:hypothetical protein